MSAKKLGSPQNSSVQEEAEGPRVLAIRIYGGGFLEGEPRQAFLASSGLKTDERISNLLPRDVIVEEYGDEMP